MSEILPGRTYDVPYPFVRTTVFIPDEDVNGSTDAQTWRPGCDGELDRDACCGVVLRAEGTGTMRLTCVGIAPLCRPYRSRVFFTRSWVDPDGKAFGKRGLRVVTLEKFARLTQGYAHAWEVDGAA